MLMDGHTHTELCPHGSGEATDKMVQRAIQLGMQRYCITEHAPLPPAFRNQYEGTLAGYTEASLRLDQVDDYLALANELKVKHAGQIEISVGFEVDFLPDHVAWTRDFLNTYGPQTQESILSVHFMRGRHDHFWPVDMSTDDFSAGFGQWLSTPQQVFEHYYQTVLASVQTDLGPYAPQRIGHMSLVRKYQDYFNLNEPLDANNLELVDQILALIKQQHRQLDLNLAGLYKPFCNDFYPGEQILKRAKKLGIPMIYGSDAHDIISVGRGYHLIKKLIKG
ncbi:histidinol-phosphatase HisJ [Lactiplantibacillus paraplantarum]|uniref:Histidinol-phosphatase n=2 Tax=Lactiplantibacillus paraplantarum TaxID=60520 RepID=A0AAD0TXB9_9LACO|nr:histidinol-phosphatase HisJ [Lactiplantibacillus paraplantarum]AVW10918.1 histidinol-phosphatase [Lactiplantibacillus paraplantarum]AYJ39325.1 histidinol-phosphatase HisJ [Lactiplantibacillus paraplantarum]KRL49819.1 histidinol-phosphatase [Lactiplantibacillus paraplantarum DSM 10667]MCU4684383.1 histidinol-phosphatase HisJ [Lactiplantibacillus paraplantarum]MDL2061401.1 histidinol-phosphatase HisJ [Lactiplantibacillus paraplantarum]